MDNETLWRYLKEKDIGIEDIDDKTGYALGYLVNLRLGRVPLSDSARFKFIRAYPETQEFLLEREAA